MYHGSGISLKAQYHCTREGPQFRSLPYLVKLQRSLVPGTFNHAGHAAGGCTVSIDVDEQDVPTRTEANAGKFGIVQAIDRKFEQTAIAREADQPVFTVKVRR